MSGSVTIPAGAATASILVDPLQDAEAEPIETVDIAITTTVPPGGSPANYHIFSSESTSVDILDNEAWISVVADIPDAYETNEVPGSFMFQRGYSSDLPQVTVTFSIDQTVENAATYGLDYSFPIGSVTIIDQTSESVTASITFGEGETNIFLPVLPVDDFEIEEDEAIELTLLPDTYSPATYLIDPLLSIAVVVVADDDIDIDITGHQPGTMAAPGAAVSEADETNPDKLWAPVNDDDDDNPQGLKDNRDTTIAAADNDIVKLTVKKPGVATGFVDLDIKQHSGSYPDSALENTTAVRLFDSSGNVIANSLSVDLADPEGPLAGLATGDVDLFLEGLSSASKVVVAEIGYRLAAGAVAARTDRVVMRVGGVDIDIDSLNNDTRGSTTSDDAEDDPSKAGRWIPVNNWDRDEDGVPGFADGIDVNNNQGPTMSYGTTKYIPMSVGLPAPIDLTKAKIRFDYPEADPATITKAGPHDYGAPASGKITIWTEGIFVDAAKQQIDRKHANVSAAANPGHFVKTGVQHDASTLGFTGTTRTITLRIEGLNPSTAQGVDTITITVDPDGSGTTLLTDVVRLTVFDFDADMDSDNTTGTLGGPNRTNSEDQIEEKAGEPGKTIPINWGNRDGDGFKDYLDGFSVALAGGGGNHMQNGPNQSAKFTPLVLEIPAPVDVTTATLMFNYSASNPANIDVGNGTPAAGKLRIWTKDGNVGRRGEDVTTAIGPIFGDFVNAGVTYTADSLGFTATTRTVTLFVEGIEAGQIAGTDEISIRMRPAEGDYSQWDDVHFTSYGFALQGKIQYDAASPKPVRGALVIAYNDDFAGDTRIGETYTNDAGNYFIPFSKAFADPYVVVETETRPAGLGEGKVRRAFVVESFSLGINFEVKPSVTTAPTINTPIGTANIVIGSTTNDEKAFWIFDAVTTASRFHATLPGVPVGTYDVKFDIVGNNSYAQNDTINIYDTHWNDWDTIIHEYGHLVAYTAGFMEYPWTFQFWNLGNYEHSLGVNMRVEHPGEDFTGLRKIAWNEGWANFYSMIAQVSIPPVINTNGGDGLLYNRHDPEDQGNFGEDEELTVMRALWDLYDPVSPGGHDRIEMGVDALFKLLATKNIKTLDQLWDAIKANAGGNNKLVIDYGSLFEWNHVSPESVGTRLAIGGALVNAWSLGSDPVPIFEWKIPVNSNGGQLLDRFGIKIFDQNFKQIFDSRTATKPYLSTAPTVGLGRVSINNTTNVAQLRLWNADWLPLARAQLGKQIHIVIYGATNETGDYWSEMQTLTINP